MERQETTRQDAPAVRATGGAGASALQRVRLWVARWDEIDLPGALRPVLVVAQAASILITWPLWQVRTTPPLLPMIDGLPQIDMGLILLATLGLVLFRPTEGVIAHSVALVAAFTLDHTRLQPEFVSIAFLLWGTTRLPHARVVAAAHLVSLWFWAGLNKALSLGFMGASAPFLFNSFPVRPEFLRPYFGWMIIVTEISIGVLLIVPRLRRAGVILAVGLHALGLIALVNARWNESVWPWNLALALAAVAFFWPHSQPPMTRRAIAVFALFGLMPVGFYAGYVDAYLAHNLYTSNTASAQICATDGSCSSQAWSGTWTTLRVPFPPEPRLYRAVFEKVCGPGETLISSPRQTRVVFGRDTALSTYECPRSSSDAP